MPDAATDNGTAPTYQVVGYDDIRGVAVDAATTAVDSIDARTDAELQSVADAAAAAALESAQEGLAETQDEHLQEVADRSLEGVSAKLDDTVARIQQVADKALAEIDERAESVDSVQVALTDEQWQYVHDSLQVQATSSILSLLMVCACFGSLLVRYFVDGWRR